VFIRSAFREEVSRHGDIIQIIRYEESFNPLSKPDQD